MKKYEMIALATQLEGATEELEQMHLAIKDKKISTGEFAEEAEELFTSVEKIWDALFELTVTVINIDNPVGQPMKTIDKAPLPESVIVKGMTKAEQATEFLLSLPKEAQREVLARYNRDTNKDRLLKTKDLAKKGNVVSH